MDIEQFIELLDNYNEQHDRQRARMVSRDRWVASCPAHEDKSPSFSVKEGDRWILTKCYSGCSTEDICSALGISVSDLAYEKPKPTSLTGKKFEDADAETLLVDVSHPRPRGLERVRLIQAARQRGIFKGESPTR